MICYKDRWWCTGSGCAKAEGCGRVYTKEEQAKAAKWWDGFGSEAGPPVQLRKANVMECFESDD